MKLIPSILTTTLLVAASWAHSLEISPFTEETLKAAQQNGKPVALHFHADWCPTCRAQQKVLNDLRSDASLDLLVLIANYDKERDLKQRLGVRAQSTLIVYRGAQEKARLAGETSTDKIRTALKAAL